MKLLTLRQVADELQVTERSVYRYIKDGKLKAHKVGKSWRIDQADLEDFVRGGTSVRPKVGMSPS